MRIRRRQGEIPVTVPAVGACGAPHASMYFAPDGQVRACCVNTAYTLGRIGPQTIREVWEGARIAALRTALDDHDYSLGCQDCERRTAAGDRAWSTAPQYDPYLGLDPGPYPRRMDFILSITCNLQCAMCDGELSSSIRLHREKRPPMPPAYGDAFFEELREFLPHLDRSVFLGGEPFVAREPQRVFDLMIEQGHTGEVQVITNGTQWNPRVERYLRELPMNVTVSVDGLTAETLEPLRVGVDRDRLFENVGRYQDAVAGHGGTVSFHYCLMRQNWHEFGRFLLEADRRGIYAIVMTVTGPAGFSLWDLPEAELRHVLAELEREDAHLAGRLGRNRSVWDDELARIRRHLDAIADGLLPEWVLTSWAPPAEVAVDVGGRGSAPTDDQTATDDARADDLGAAIARADAVATELTRWSGREPLRVRVAGVEVRSVEVPGWAAPLEPHSWVGTPVASLLSSIEDRLGPAADLALDVDPVDARITTSRGVFAAPSGTVELRSVAGPGPTAAELTVVLVVDADLAPAVLDRA